MYPMNYYRVLSRVRAGKPTVRSKGVFSEAKRVGTYVPNALMYLRVMVELMRLGNCSVSIEDLSNTLGTDPKHLGRVLSRLADMGLIEYLGGECRLSRLGELMLSRLVNILHGS